MDFISRLIGLGIKPDLDRSDIKRIRLVNILSLIAAIYLLIRAVFNLGFLKFNYSLLQFIVSFLFLGIILLNKAGLHRLSRHGFIIAANFFVFLFSYFYFGGTFGGGQSLYVVFIMVPLVLFDVKRKKDIIIGMLVCIFFVSLLFYCQYAIPRKTDFSNIGIEATKISVTILAMVIAFAIIYFFYKLNQESEKEILEANDNLYRSRKELEKERNLLRIKNDQIQADLFVARKIQGRFLPKPFISENISWYFKPMNELGGDFIKFIFPDHKRRSDSNYEKHRNHIFVFLSDVSGHGVSSAFITIMINSYLEKNDIFNKTPGQILAELGREIQPFAFGSFITAFTAIIDTESKIMTFANSGHPSPYLISEKGKTELPTDKRGMPLCVDLIKDRGRDLAYPDDTFKLESGDLLFMFTDGVLETVPLMKQFKGPSPEDFETARLDYILPEFYKLNPADCAQLLIESLVNYRGDQNFDDDICYGFIRI